MWLTMISVMAVRSFSSGALSSWIGMRTAYTQALVCYGATWAHDNQGKPSLDNGNFNPPPTLPIT
jgi:hypothetical protein